MNIGEHLKNIFSLEGKVLLLTGAGGGIGGTIATGLAGAGGKMALCDLNPTSIAAVAEEITKGGGTAKCYPLDVSDTTAMRACVKQVMADYGRIDVLVNCAGINRREGFLDVSEETYDKIMDINLRGLYFLSQEVAKEMRLQGGGNIVNVASHNSVGMLGGCSVYGATKSAVVALTRSMAVEWAQYGIRANAIAPGHILTPLTTVTWEHPERSRYLKERISMGRPGLPQELVGTLLLLCSDASSYLSGTTIHVDGGCLAGGQPWPYDTSYPPTIPPEEA